MNIPTRRHIVLLSLAQSFGILVLSVAAALGVNALRSDRLSWMYQPPVAETMVTAAGDTLTVSLEEAHRQFLSRTAVFIDARRLEDYQEGHIKGALNLPWQEAENRFFDVMADVAPDRMVITYCDGEACSLSRDLALFLRDAGFEHARVLVNGWGLWRDKGLPIEKE